MANEGIEGFTKHTDIKLNLNIFWKFFNNFDIKHREIAVLNPKCSTWMTNRMKYSNFQYILMDYNNSDHQ